MGRAAILLDRDGTLNVDTGYVGSTEQFHFIEGVIGACVELQQMGYVLVVITNQSGIARGYFSEAHFLKLTDWMQQTLAAQGVNLAAVYYCPHHPDLGRVPYRQQCDCRKPQPGLLFKAQRTFDLDLARSYMVGDSLSDLQAAAAAGVGTKVLVRSGQPVTAAVAVQADWVLESLVDLPAAICAR